VEGAREEGDLVAEKERLVEEGEEGGVEEEEVELQEVN